MAKKTSDNSGYQLDHQKLRAIQDELRNSYDDLTSPKLRLNQFVIEKLVRQMKKPTWSMKTHNLIKGMFNEFTVQMEVHYTFHLDIKSLIQKLDKRGGKILKDLQKEAEKLGGSQLSQLITESIMPYSLGVLAEKEVKRLEVTSESGERLQVSLPESGYVMMHAAPELVFFNYTDLLIPQANTKILSFKLDQDEFERQVFLAVAYLHQNRSVSETYQWQQQNSVSDLSILIRAEFNQL